MTSLLTTGVQFPDATLQTTAAPDDIVIMWWGNILEIPEGWELDSILEDKFVVGAGDLYAVGSTGGAASVTLTAPQIPSHTHPTTASIEPVAGHTHDSDVSNSPNHSHPFSPSSAIRLAPGTSFGVGPGSVQSSPIGTTPNHGHSVSSLETDGAHTHTASYTAAPSGDGSSHENLPPYYALVFLRAI